MRKVCNKLYLSLSKVLTNGVKRSVNYSRMFLCWKSLDFETRAAGQDAALKVFNNSRGYAEANDPYIERVFDNIEDHWQAFERFLYKYLCHYCVI